MGYFLSFGLLDRKEKIKAQGPVGSSTQFIFYLSLSLPEPATRPPPWRHPRLPELRISPKKEEMYLGNPNFS
jgi:hypothetical protein